MSYTEAETILLQQRCGRNYERLTRAEDEAAEALGRAFSRIEAGEMRAWRAFKRIDGPK